MNISRLLIALGAIIVLGSVNYSIVAKERIKRDGETVYVKLLPVDPRSLMQGDYMALRFELAEAIRENLNLDLDSKEALLQEGQYRRAAIALDDRRIASLPQAGAPDSLDFRYRIRRGKVWLGTNALFFEEGTAQRYAKARYGEFKVDRQSGEAVLVGLRDEALQPL
jgi:uncharacterized membrane-anchored protein